MIPRATYRVQFHKDFPFRAAIPLARYWARLGISHIYASPIATARAGSLHGYDVVDPSRINPELGGEGEFRALAAALKKEGIGILLDIVPNHVAVGQGDNPWWQDLLEKGEGSAFANWFDIDWRSCNPELDGKLVAPFLGAPYAEVLANGDLRLERRGDRLAVIAHGTHVFPLRPEDQRRLSDTDPRDFHEPAAMHALCERQHWRLAWWRSAGDVINWRRFFDITELAGLRIEEDAVFEAVHALPVRLYREGLIDGVRVDHIDGLADPAAYCHRLRQSLDEAESARPAAAARGPAYIVVEKILAPGETLPSDWGVDGTSGYDFLNDVSALLHDPAGTRPLARLWHRLSGRPGDFGPEEQLARTMFLEQSFANQLDSASQAFARLAASDLRTRDIAGPALRRAIHSMIRAFRVYRTYGTGAWSPIEDANAREDAVAVAQQERGLDESATVRTVGDWLAGQGPGDAQLKREAVRRFQQLSAPIAAKAVEDTAFYRYGRLLSRNDVGCDPARLGSTPQEFSRFLCTRARLLPDTMLTTATHDHKRGEDVRARLAVLSEIPGRWSYWAERWIETVPSDVGLGDAHMLHQMIVGAWPIMLQAQDTEEMEDYRTRLAQWQLKALREAKLATSWSHPDEGYEAACRAYLDTLLVPGSALSAEMARFASEIAPAGYAKSLAQTLLRYTVPGVPDLYQGAESWDLSLVDPDNRRPVDYGIRERLLDDDVDDWLKAASKLHLIRDLLLLRKEHPELFSRGDVRFASVSGSQSLGVVALERRFADLTFLAMCTVRASQRCIDRGSPDPGQDWWGDTVIELSDGRTIDAAQIAGDRAIGYRFV